MQNALQLLEKYVEWIALGIGLLVLGLLASTYLTGKPVTVNMNGKDYGPGELDKQINQEMAVVRRQMDPKSGAKLPATKMDPASELSRNVQYPTPQSMAIVWADLIKPEKIEITTPVEVKAKPVVLTKTTAAQPVASSSGRSVISYEKPQPANVNPNAIAAAPQVQLQQMDVDWISWAWTIPVAKLAEVFKAAMPAPPAGAGAAAPALPGNLPAAAQAMPDLQTQVIAVYLYRQEKLPNGQWPAESEQTAIPTPPWILVVPPPAAGPSNFAVQNDFVMNWLPQNVAQISQAPFASVVAGEAWYVPGQPKPAQVMPAVDPAGAPLPPGVIPARPIPPEGVAVPEGPGIPPVPRLQPAPPPATPPFGPGAVAPRPVPGVLPEGAVQPEIGGPFAPGAANIAGVFAPAQMQQDIPLVTHDITCKESRTYRYRLRYALLNPLWNSPLAPDEKTKFEVSLFSHYSDWSPEVKIASRTIFYVKGLNQQRGGNGIDAVIIDIFEWKDGFWRVRSVPLRPGDGIEGTKWAVADLRGTARNGHVLLSDPEGKMHRRDPATEALDPDYQQLKLQAGAAAAAPLAPVGAAAPFTPTGVTGPAIGGTRVPVTP